MESRSAGGRVRSDAAVWVAEGMTPWEAGRWRVISPSGATGSLAAWDGRLR